MQLNNILYCHWDLVRFVPESYLSKFDAVSVTDGEKFQYMIFLGKDDVGSGYEVRVYKSKSIDKYVPNKYDADVKRYEENDEYATFFFDNYNSARSFVELLGYVHPEYRVRPCKEIGA